MIELLKEISTLVLSNSLSETIIFSINELKINGFNNMQHYIKILKLFCQFLKQNKINIVYKSNNFYNKNFLYESTLASVSIIKTSLSLPSLSTSLCRKKIQSIFSQSLLLPSTSSMVLPSSSSLLMSSPQPQQLTQQSSSLLSVPQSSQLISKSLTPPPPPPPPPPPSLLLTSPPPPPLLPPPPLNLKNLFNSKIESNIKSEIEIPKALKPKCVPPEGKKLRHFQWIKIKSLSEIKNSEKIQEHKLSVWQKMDLIDLNLSIL